MKPKTATASNLIAWINEREEIRIRREAGAPPPWTDDPILGGYRFCNVRREDDAVTRWITHNWRTPHANNPDLWHAIATARFVNWTETLMELDYPVLWNREHFVAVLSARMARKEGTFGPAYNISNGGKSVPKVQHVADVLDGLWRRRASVRPRADDCLLSFHGRLRQCDGMGEFMSAQVIADLKYAQLRDARDWMTFAASGPGSRRGLNRVLGRPTDAHWQEEAWRAALRQLHDAVRADLERIGLGDLHAQDLQNCLCEFDKYERTRLGEGKPKRTFRRPAA